MFIKFFLLYYYQAKSTSGIYSKNQGTMCHAKPAPAEKILPLYKTAPIAMGRKKAG